MGPAAALSAGVPAILDAHQDLVLLLLGEAFKPGVPKNIYACWRDALFARTNPPVLESAAVGALESLAHQVVWPLGLIDSVAVVEYELIALVGAAHTSELLNVQGRC